MKYLIALIFILSFNFANAQLLVDNNYYFPNGSDSLSKIVLKLVRAKPPKDSAYYQFKIDKHGRLIEPKFLKGCYISDTIINNLKKHIVFRVIKRRHVPKDNLIILKL